MIIGVVNNKGGVLKTTLSTNLGASMSMSGKKIILVDLDGQGNVSATFGKSPYTIKNSVMDFLKGDCNLTDCIIQERENLHILPGNDDLNFFDYYIKSGEITQSNLKIMLKKLDEVYDYVIIDTPPNMSTVVATVLSINDVVLIPFEPDQYAILGLKRIVDAAKEFISKGNSNMKIISVPTKVNTRVTIHNEIIEQVLRPKLTSQGVYVTKTFISSSTKSTAAVGYEKVPIVFSIVKSKYQDEYHSLKNEILDYIEIKEQQKSNYSVNSFANSYDNQNNNQRETNLNNESVKNNTNNFYGEVKSYDLETNKEKENVDSEEKIMNFEYKNNN